MNRLDVRNFPKTVIALKAFFKFEESFDAMVAEMATLHSSQVVDFSNNWIAERRRLSIACGQAFVDETSDINGTDKAHHVFPSDICRVIGYPYGTI